jgi:hypothetical protein
MKHPSEIEFHGMKIPDYMADGLIRYVEDGIPPGDFLTAVLENDLSEAIGRADEANIKVIPAYVFWLYNYAPIGCWGSKAKVKSWMKRKAEAEAWAEEECKWEGTHHAVIRGPDKYECFYMGDFS